MGLWEGVVALQKRLGSDLQGHTAPGGESKEDGWCSIALAEGALDGTQISYWHLLSTCPT